MGAVNKIYTHLDLNSNEIRDVRLEHLESDPAAASGRFYYNSKTREVRYSDGEKWGSLNVGIWSIDEDGNIVASGNVIIDGNLVIKRDTSSGGEGQKNPSVGGISGIRVNGTLYEDYDSDGIIDLGIISGGDVDVDLTDYVTIQELEGKNYAKESSLAAVATSGKYSDLSGLPRLGSLASKNSLAVTDIPDLSSKYLPLSGGTLKNTTYSTVLRIDGASNALMDFLSAGTKIGSFGMTASGGLVTINADGSKIYNIIHDRNYSSYALPLDGGTMNANSTIKWTHSNDENWNTAVKGLKILRYASTSNVSTNGSFANYATALHIANSATYGFQIGYNAGHTDNNYISSLKYRGYSPNNSAWGAWKTIAFTDSDITGNAATASKLASKVSLWGNDFDGSAALSGTIVVGNSTNSGELENTKVIFKTTTTGGWDRGMTMQVYDANEKVYKTRCRFGAYGNSGSALDYGYIGTGYTNTWVKFTPSKTTFKGDVYVEGNLIVSGDTSSGGSGEPSTNQGLDEDAVMDLLEREGYATQSWVEGKKYLTGITSALVTSALGYSPYNSANFTKANIKSTLGISDWALAASKPSYTYSEVGVTKSVITSLIGTTTYAPYNANGYLPKSGGTITGGLTINPSNGGSSFYMFNADDTYRLTHIWDGNTARLYNIKNDGSAYGTLNLQGTIQIDGNTIIHSGNIKDYNAGGLQTSGGISAVTIDTSKNAIFAGNVGIGTTDPSQKLDVNGYVRAFANDSSNRHILAANSVASVSLYAATSGNRGLWDYTNSKWIIYTDATNTYIKNYPLSIEKAVTMSSSLTIASTLIAKAQYHYFYATGGDTNTYALRFAAAATGTYIQAGKFDGSSNNGTLILSGYNGNNLTELQVKGPASMSSTLSVGGGLYLGTNSLYMTYNNNDMSVYTASAGKPIFGYGTSAKGYDTYVDGYQVHFRYGTSHTEGMILNSSGKVGIGVTDPAYALDIAAGGGMQLKHTTNPHFRLTNDSYYAYVQLLSSGDLAIGKSSALGLHIAQSGAVSTDYGVTAKTFTVGSTTGEAHIIFSRTTANYLTAPEGGTIRFVTNGKAVSIANSDLSISDGNVKVNGTLEATTSVSTPIVTHTGGIGLKAQSGASACNIWLTTNVFRPYTADAGLIDLGASNIQWRNVYAINGIFSGDTSSGSDIRFKDIIENKTIKIEDIANAPCFTFKWNDREDDTLHLGTSAQYWENVAPELVSGSDFKTLNYASLGVAMGIALAKKNINHEERIKMLEDEVKVLNAEIKRLRNGQIC